MKNKKLLTSFIIIMIILTCALSGCTRDVPTGVYVNKNNDSEKIIVTENTISFVNVNFDAFNKELKDDFGVDFRLTYELTKENDYRCEGNTIFVSVLDLIEVNFEYTNKYIIVNESKFIIEDKGD